MTNEQEKESLKQTLHEQTLDRIESLGSFSTDQNSQIQQKIERLAEIENERYNKNNSTK